MHDTFDPDDEALSPSPIWLWLPSIILFLYLPISALLGSARFEWGARAFAPSAGIRFFFCFFVHTFITCPVIAWPLVSQRGRDSWSQRPMRTALVIVLLCLPLASLAYYLGEVKEAIQAMDVLVAVLPAAAIAVLQYRRLRSAVAFVFVLGVTSFVSLFFVGDILGPLPTLVDFASQGPGVYFWRALCAALSILCAAYAHARTRPVAADNSAFRALLIAAVLLLVGLLAARGIEGFAPSAFSVALSALSVLGLAGLFLLLRRPAAPAIGTLATLVGVTLVGELLLGGWARDASLVGQMLLLAEALAAGLVLFIRFNGLAAPST